MKKEYISPRFDYLEVTFTSDALSGSVENYSSYVSPEPGDWTDPIIESGDDIKW